MIVEKCAAVEDLPAREGLGILSFLTVMRLQIDV
jgi:hypothetical protein